MANTLLQIDKKYGTSYSTKIMEGSFMGLINYIEEQYNHHLAPFESISPKFDAYLKGDLSSRVNKLNVVDYLNDATMDILSEVVEYAAEFLTTQYKLSDFEEIKEKLIRVATQINSLASYRHDHYKDFYNYLKS